MRQAKKINRLISALLVIFTITGCATIFTGPTQEIRFESNKPVHIYVKGKYVGKTPVTYHFNKGMVTVIGSGTLPHLPVTIEGSEKSETINLMPGNSAWLWGDLILDFVIAFGSAYLLFSADIITNDNVVLAGGLCGALGSTVYILDILSGSLYKYPKIIKINVVE